MVNNVGSNKLLMGTVLSVSVIHPVLMTAVYRRTTINAYLVGSTVSTVSQETSKWRAGATQRLRR